MRKSVIASVVFAALLASSAAYSQNKVVVIPMGSSGGSGGSSWVKLYDKNNAFIGYTDFYSTHIANPIFIINDKKYCSEIFDDGTVGTGAAFLYYLSPDCKSNPVFSYLQNNMVCDGYLYDLGYVDYNETPLPPTTTYYSEGFGVAGPCTAYTGAYLYQIHPNNPAITGFNNSYPTPIRAEFTLPQ